MIRKSILLFITTTCTLPVQANYLGGFANISINYLDWTTHTTHKTGQTSHKDDFAYLELEGEPTFHGVSFMAFLT